jgi:hypothetical protein
MLKRMRPRIEIDQHICLILTFELTSRWELEMAILRSKGMCMRKGALSNCHQGFNAGKATAVQLVSEV